MKIAIQGHPIRGKEVIKILESLGGKNIHELYGNGKDCVHHYHIDSCGIITLSSKYDLHNYKFYTLEEFEKEFPFKIGDIVLLKGVNVPYEIIALELYMNKLCYKLDNGLHYGPETLMTCQKMKEERNITLTLDKAKEWYKKGGELREIALQAFTERELNPLPRSWEEYTDKMALIIVSTDKLPLSTLPKKYIALYKLEQLRGCWIQGWKPNWNDKQQAKYCVVYHHGEFKISLLYETGRFLSFPTIEMAEEFLECFRDLIEKTGDLI